MALGLWGPEFLQGTKGKVLHVHGVLLPCPQLRPRAKSMSGSQHLMSCLITQPGCQGNVLVGVKDGQGKEFVFFLFFTT